eukprot:2042520-Karenia_brevis.AAC.1
MVSSTAGHASPELFDIYDSGDLFATADHASPALVDASIQTDATSDQLQCGHLSNCVGCQTDQLQCGHLSYDDQL